MNPLQAVVGGASSSLTETDKLYKHLTSVHDAVDDDDGSQGEDPSAEPGKLFCAILKCCYIEFEYPTQLLNLFALNRPIPDPLLVVKLAHHDIAE